MDVGEGIHRAHRTRAARGSPEEGHGLRAGADCVRAERKAARAGGDVVIDGPFDCVIEVIKPGDIMEIELRAISDDAGEIRRIHKVIEHDLAGDGFIVRRIARGENPGVGSVGNHRCRVREFPCHAAGDGERAANRRQLRVSQRFACVRDLRVCRRAGRNCLADGDCDLAGGCFRVVRVGGLVDHHIDRAGLRCLQLITGDLCLAGILAHGVADCAGDGAARAAERQRFAVGHDRCAGVGQLCLRLAVCNADCQLIGDGIVVASEAQRDCDGLRFADVRGIKAVGQLIGDHACVIRRSDCEACRAVFADGDARRYQRAVCFHAAHSGQRNGLLRCDIVADRDRLVSGRGQRRRGDVGGQAGNCGLRQRVVSSVCTGDCNSLACTGILRIEVCRRGRELDGITVYYTLKRSGDGRRRCAVIDLVAGSHAGDGQRLGCDLEGLRSGAGIIALEAYRCRSLADADVIFIGHIVIIRRIAVYGNLRLDCLTGVGLVRNCVDRNVAVRQRFLRDRQRAVLRCDGVVGVRALNFGQRDRVAAGDALRDSGRADGQVQGILTDQREAILHAPGEFRIRFAVCSALVVSFDRYSLGLNRDCEGLLRVVFRGIIGNSNRGFADTCRLQHMLFVLNDVFYNSGRSCRAGDRAVLGAMLDVVTPLHLVAIGHGLGNASHVQFGVLLVYNFDMDRQVVCRGILRRTVVIDIDGTCADCDRKCHVVGCTGFQDAAVQFAAMQSCACKHQFGLFACVCCNKVCKIQRAAVLCQRRGVRLGSRGGQLTLRGSNGQCRRSRLFGRIDLVVVCILERECGFSGAGSDIGCFVAGVGNARDLFIAAGQLDAVLIAIVGEGGHRRPVVAGQIDLALGNGDCNVKRLCHTIDRVAECGLIRAIRNRAGQVACQVSHVDRSRIAAFVLRSNGQASRIKCLRVCVLRFYIRRVNNKLCQRILQNRDRDSAMDSIVIDFVSRREGVGILRRADRIERAGFVEL